MSLSPLRLNEAYAGAPLPRLGLPLSGALLITLLLFALMQWLIYAPRGSGFQPVVIEAVELVSPEDETPEAPGGAPPAPPALAPPPVPSLSDLAVPVAAAPALEVAAPNLNFTPQLGGGNSFGKAFGGFAGRGGAGTGSGSGFGSGQGFRGKPLVPLSTQRPQIPESAYRRGVEGWVQVVFTVNTEGRVVDIKIVDAEPKGVFETAAVSGVSTWLYERSERPREVTQRIEFKLEDFKYNWN